VNAAVNRMNSALTPLRVLAALELASLAVLLVNLATDNSRPLAAAVGPIHGFLYLSVIITVVRAPRTTRQTIALSALPVIGGILAVRRLALDDKA
jgi:hypothetical protein